MNKTIRKLTPEECANNTAHLQAAHQALLADIINPDGSVPGDATNQVLNRLANLVSGTLASIMVQQGEGMAMMNSFWDCVKFFIAEHLEGEIKNDA